MLEIQTQSKPTQSMSARVLAWSNGIPEWQSDALRRLYKQGTLAAADIKDITTMVKEAYGLMNPGTCVKPHPLSAADLPIDAQAGTLVTLGALFNVENTNALLDGQTIKFASTGLTVVYGGNGTGKSGYCRILKKASRARHVDKAILGNVFKQKITGKAKASIQISAPDERTLAWEDGQPSADELGSIAVFDSHCARLIIDEAAGMSYMPYRLDVFPKLASLLNEIKLALEQEMRAQQPTPLTLIDLAGSHEVGQFVADLSKDTDLKKLDRLSVLDKQETARIAEIEKIIQNDPVKQAEAIDRLARRLKALAKLYSVIEPLLSLEIRKKLEHDFRRLLILMLGAQLGALRRFDSEPLQGVGSAEWIALYRAAEAFSSKHAYPGQSFPFLGEGACCVFCQQEVSGEANDRLERFNSFANRKITDMLNAAQATLSEQLQCIASVSFPAIDKEIVDELRSFNGELSDTFEARSGQLKNALDKVARLTDATEYSPPIHLSNDLIATAETLEEKASNLRATARPEEIARITIELAGLKARKLLTVRKPDIVAYVLRLQRIANYRRAIVDLRTNEITNKGKELTSEALTDSLKAKLKNEIDFMGIHLQGLNLDYRPAGSYGETKHELHAQGIEVRSVQLTNILSEGEQTVTALAAFLAEAQITPLAQPLIFDDPVCSLDHRWSNKIAERLAFESTKRQVIIFTHDVSFLKNLKSHIGTLGAGDLVSVVHLRRFKNTPGFCDSDDPWETRTTKQRITYLKALQAEADHAWKEDAESEKFRRAHAYFYDRLRGTWEYLVEDELLFQTVVRYREGIETKRLHSVAVTDRDFTTVFNAMDLCSKQTHAHDHTRGSDHSNVRTPAETLTDISGLEAYYKTITTDREKTSTHRKALVSPNK